QLPHGGRARRLVGQRPEDATGVAVALPLVGARGVGQAIDQPARAPGPGLLLDLAGDLRGHATAGSSPRRRRRSRRGTRPRTPTGWRPGVRRLVVLGLGDLLDPYLGSPFLVRGSTAPGPSDGLAPGVAGSPVGVGDHPAAP